MYGQADRTKQLRFKIILSCSLIEPTSFLQTEFYIYQDSRLLKQPTANSPIRVSSRLQVQYGTQCKVEYVSLSFSTLYLLQAQSWLYTLHADVASSNPWENSTRRVTCQIGIRLPRPLPAVPARVVGNGKLRNWWRSSWRCSVGGNSLSPFLSPMFIFRWTKQSGAERLQGKLRSVVWIEVYKSDVKSRTLWWGWDIPNQATRSDKQSCQCVRWDWRNQV